VIGHLPVPAEWGARPVPLGGVTGLRPAAPTAPAPPPAPLVSRRGADERTLARLRGRGGAVRRQEVLSALPVQSQRVVVMSAAGGVGRSLVTAGVALAVARQRKWPVAAVDVADRPFTTLAVRLGVAGGPTVRDVLPALGAVGAGVELAPYVRVVRPGGTEQAGEVHVLAAANPDQQPLDPAETASMLARLGSLYPTVLVDCPAGLIGAYQRAAAAGASVIAAVVRAQEDELRRGAAAIRALDPAIPRIAIVVAARPGRWDRHAAAAEPVLGAACASVLRLPWDPALAKGRPVSEARSAAATAFDEIAAAALWAAGQRAEGRS
jgi:MinD-like ATPase involved in chromosome partitioning or flagellar assembly